jgi:hypothetical protein
MLEARGDRATCLRVSSTVHLPASIARTSAVQSQDGAAWIAVRCFTPGT